jgi:hypothetical protein
VLHAAHRAHCEDYPICQTWKPGTVAHLCIRPTRQPVETHESPPAPAPAPAPAPRLRPHPATPLLYAKALSLAPSMYAHVVAKTTDEKNEHRGPIHYLRLA